MEPGGVVHGPGGEDGDGDRSRDHEPREAAAQRDAGRDRGARAASTSGTTSRGAVRICSERVWVSSPHMSPRTAAPARVGLTRNR